MIKGNRPVKNWPVFGLLLILLLTLYVQCVIISVSKRKDVKGLGMKRAKYCYNGEYYTVADLSRLTGLSISSLYNRLKSGWNVEDAVETPVEECCTQTLEERWRGKTLSILFHEPIPEVFSEMQPMLEKVYIAIPSIHNGGKEHGGKQHFVITLDNGKPLIVYPGEFEIVGEVED